MHKMDKGTFDPNFFHIFKACSYQKKLKNGFVLDRCVLNSEIVSLKVLQEQLIKAERERILQEIKSGALTADTGKKLLKKIDEEVEESDDKIPPTLAKRLKNGHQTSTTTTTKYSKSSSKNQGGRK